jgi:Domain of unknown function (DUF4365)
LQEQDVASTSVPTKERVGINAVEAIFLKDFEWLFREQPVSDFGIDAQVEIVEGGEVTGKLIGLQIKTGSSHFRKKGDGFVFYGEPRHLEYWTRHSLPVFLILHDPDTGVTLWQKVERRLATETDHGWSIIVPSTNTLTVASKSFFSEGISSDDESIRRFNFAFDLETMRFFREKYAVYFEVNDWVNKSLNIRDIGVFFDEPEKDIPDFMIRLWAPSTSLSEFMQRYFPWLDYEYMEIIESLDGEVEVHSIHVWVNELGKQYIGVEDYFTDGPSDRDEPPPPGKEETEYDPDWEEHAAEQLAIDDEELERLAKKAGI